MDSTARWRGTIGAAAWAPAFKPGPVPLCQIPGLERACRIEPDTMHVFHLGFGQDLAAGSIVMLAKFDLFKDNGSFDAKLAEGYDRFMEYCHRNGKTTSCDLFATKKFGMASTLWICISMLFVICCIALGVI